MNNESRYVIESATLVHGFTSAAPQHRATRIPKHDERFSWGRTAVRALQVLLGCGGLGASAHDAFGSTVAALLALLIFPLLAGLGLVAWCCRGDSPDVLRTLAWHCGSAVSVAVGLLTLPGALYGWHGVAVTLSAATVTYGLSLQRALRSGPELAPTGAG